MSKSPIRITEANAHAIPFPCWLWSSLWSRWYHSDNFSKSGPDLQEATHYSTSPTQPEGAPGEAPIDAARASQPAEEGRKA